MVWAQLALGAAVVAGSLYSGYKQAQNAKDTAEEARKYDAEVRALVDKLQTPTFNWDALTPEEFQLVRSFAPQYTEFVAEQAPQTIEGMSEAAQAGQKAQLEALSKFQELSKTGRDIESDILTQRARQEVGAADRALKGQILQDIRRRGAGGGAEIAASLASSQAAGNRGATMAENAAIEAARRRLEAIKQTGALGSDIRGQELSMEGKNVDIINAFNQRQAARKQGWAEGQADIANRAQMFNIGEEQRISDANVGLRNAAQIQNLERENALRQKQFENEARKMGLKTGQVAAEKETAIEAGQQRGQQIAAITDAAITAGKYGYEAWKDSQKNKPKVEEDEEGYFK